MASEDAKSFKPADRLGEDALASDSELQTIAELRIKLEPELTKLKEDKKDFPHTTGDIFFTRLIRGMNGDEAAAIEWFRKFLEMRVKFGLDDIHMDCEKNNIPWEVTALPHYDEMRKYMNNQLDEKVRSLGGHLVWYDSMGDAKVKALFNDVGKDKIIKFFHYLLERRTSVMDRLSREEGRLVRVVRIMDLDGFGLWQLTKEWMALDREYLTPVAIGASVESTKTLFAVHFPWFATKVYETAFKPFLPERVTKRIRFLDGAFLQNAEYLKEVGPALNKQLTSTKQVVSNTDPNAGALEGSSEIIAAGKVMERVVEVSAGQKVTWDYRVAKPDEVATKRSLLGKIATAATSAFAGTEIVFSVYALWTDKTEADIETVPAKVRSAGLEAGDAAEFWVDGKPVEFTVGAGINVVAVNPVSKEVISKETYDAVADADGASAKLVADLKALPRACMVLVSVKGTGSEKLNDDAIDALKTVGATITSGHWHEGYALIGRKHGLAVSEKRGPDVTAEGDVPTMEMEAELVEPREVAADAGVTKGSVTAERGGLVMVRWSNFHSFVAKKMVTDFKVAVE